MSTFFAEIPTLSKSKIILKNDSSKYFM